MNPPGLGQLLGIQSQDVSLEFYQVFCYRFFLGLVTTLTGPLTNV